MKSFHFSVGDSTDGPLGLCAAVTAKTAKQALELLRANLPDEWPLPMYGTERADGSAVEYVNVYLNPANITDKDIDEVASA